MRRRVAALLRDEGSAYRLILRGFRAAIRSIEGPRRPAGFTPCLSAALGCGSPQRLFEWSKQPANSVCRDAHARRIERGSRGGGIPGHSRYVVTRPVDRANRARVPTFATVVFGRLCPDMPASRDGVYHIAPSRPAGEQVGWTGCVPVRGRDPRLRCRSALRRPSERRA